MKKQILPRQYEMNFNRLVIPYPESFKYVDFGLNRGVFGAYTEDEFYPIDEIFLAEDGIEYPLKAVRTTELSKKLNENNVLAEAQGYLIVRE